jgi:hypothetical protein
MFAAIEGRGRMNHPLSFNIKLVKATDSLVERGVVRKMSNVLVVM